MQVPEVSQHWLRALEQLAPRSEKVSWLKLHWEPSVGRWFIYQVYPAYITPALFLTDDQRWQYDGTTFRPDPKERLCLERRSVNESQWAIFQETGCYSQAFWVIQGNAGGHKRSFNMQERKILKLNGRPEEAPEPGSLPYAPLDSRVIDKLGPLDTLRKYHRMLDFTERTTEMLEADERDAEEHMKTVLYGWLQSQVSEAVETSGVNFKDVLANAPVAADGEQAVREASHERFLKEPF